MRKKRLRYLFVCLIAAIPAQAQVFPGYHTSQFAGVHAVPFNPALAAGSRYKWDVNIIGADVKAGNTYYSFVKSSLLSGQEKMVRNVDYIPDTNATRKQYGWGSADVMLPSVLYSIDEKQSVAFTWRIRGSANAGGMGTPIANFFALNYPNPRFTDRNFVSKYAAGNGNAWNEFALSYARVIKDKGDHRWKAGISLKYLGGQASAYTVVRDASFTFNTTQLADINSGRVHYGYNEELDEYTSQDSWSSVYSPFQNPGIGLDVGVVYEWRPDNDGFGSMHEGGPDWNPDADTWKARFGVSIVDIGGMSYRKSVPSANLDVTADNVLVRSLNKQRNESMRRYATRIATMFTPLENDDTYYMNLPTSLNMFGDINLNGRFFLSASATVALNGGEKDDNKTNALTQFLITPRFELKNLGLYLPISVNRFGQADAGFALRAGPLVIGSASLFSNLSRQMLNHADVFVALRVVPIRLGKWSWDKGSDGTYRKRRHNIGCPTI
ncbi:DUF5723 family protein [Chitinophaga sp.]|uniref:DUF5723 family protein n=1 Tax=Chitinophaga sp. TaxID=1869181 RepID=UPI0026182870|nr:DUF5723 family protein [uncultured Chitinophaga sp.]